MAMTATETIPTAIPGLELRWAQEGDIPLILDYIRELAQYERLADQVMATEENLGESLFGPQPAAEVILAELVGEPVGFALFFQSFSTFLGRPGLYIEDLFVRPLARGHGVGRALLAFLAALTLERGMGRLDWVVLDWNEAALRFYGKLGATAMDEWTTYRIEASALKSLAAEAGQPS